MLWVNLLVLIVCCLLCHYLGFCAGIKQEKEDRQTEETHILSHVKDLRRD